MQKPSQPGSVRERIQTFTVNSLTPLIDCPSVIKVDLLMEASVGGIVDFSAHRFILPVLTLVGLSPMELRSAVYFLLLRK